MMRTTCTHRALHEYVLLLALTCYHALSIVVLCSLKANWLHNDVASTQPLFSKQPVPSDYSFLPKLSEDRPLTRTLGCYTGCWA